MAGKHVGVLTTGSTAPGTAANMLKNRPEFPGSILDRAYAEGRVAGKAGVPGTANPHPLGSKAFGCWALGNFHSPSNAFDAVVQTHNPQAV